MGMNGLLSYSIKETREQLSSLIDQVAIAKKSFMINKFGKPKAMVTPVLADKKTISARKAGILATAGAWKHRTDIQDTAKWVENIRHRMSSRLF